MDKAEGQRTLNSMPPTLFQELCYGKFIEGFISTLNNISTKHKNDCHIEKVCKNMRQLTEICPKLKVSCS